MTFEPSPTAREMAGALRSGVSARLRDFEAATPDEDLAHLRALGGLDEVPAVAKPTGWAVLVRAARRALGGLLRPWLSAQTAFNRAIADKSVESGVTALVVSRRVAELERSVHLLDERLRALEGPGVRTRTEAVRLDRDTLLRLIVQSRMLPPPARVLVRGSRVIAQDLITVGYDVLEAVHRQEQAGGSFDAVVWLSRAVPDEEDAADWAAELPRLLRTGGRAIVAHTSRDALEERDLHGLLIQSRVTAREDESGWTVVDESLSVPVPRQALVSGPLTIVVLDRPYAAGR